MTAKQIPFATKAKAQLQPGISKALVLLLARLGLGYFWISSRHYSPDIQVHSLSIA